MKRVLGVLLCCSAACMDPPAEPTWLDSPLEAYPESFSEVGLFAEGDLTALHPRALLYEPEWPLWSSGSIKTRHMVLPPGTSIDTTGDLWEFPVGSILAKTFAYNTETGMDLVETRLLRRTEMGWDYATYLWSEGDRDAVLLEGRRSTPVDVSPLGGEPFVHVVPNLLACRACHESADTEVLGFRDIQLSADAFSELQASGHLSETARPHQQIQADDAETEFVLGYFQGNCVHCHNAGTGPNSSFDLRPDVALENTIDHRTETSGIADGIRVLPGNPEESILYLNLIAADSMGDIKAMPPLGIDVRDATAVARIRDWIQNL